jgi:hypothetical protein
MRRTGCRQALILEGMRKPIFVRLISDDERETLEAGLRSSDAFVLRRCQILLASERGENAYQIARSLGCDPQTVRNAIHKFNEEGGGGPEAALVRNSSRPHTVHMPPSIPSGPRSSRSCCTEARGSSVSPPVGGRLRWPPRLASKKA